MAKHYLYRTTLKCLDCFTQTRLDPQEPRTTRTPVQYCLYCGSTHITLSQDNDLDAWESLATAFDPPMPIPALISLYEMWAQDSTKHPFIDWAKELIHATVE